MKKDLCLLAAAAALFAAGAAVSPAEAGPRLRSLEVFFPPLYFIDPHPEDFYSGPQGDPAYDRPPPRPRRYNRAYNYDYSYDPAYNGPYGDPGYNQGYYEPQTLPPSRPVKKTTKTTTKTPSTAPGKTATTRPVTASANAARTTAASRLTCDKAGGIVSGYGFSGVKAQSCAGSSYRFLAQRGGKNYAVTVASASGELTEVKKLP